VLKFDERGQTGAHPPVRDMIVQDFVVTAVFIVVTAVLRGDFLAMDFVGRQTQVPNLRILLDLGAFEFRQSGAVILHRLLGRHGQSSSYFFHEEKHMRPAAYFRESARVM